MQRVKAFTNCDNDVDVPTHRAVKIYQFNKKRDSNGSSGTGNTKGM